MDYNFDEQLRRGKILEDIVIGYFKDKNPDNLYLDVSENKTFQDIDIDLLETSKSAVDNSIKTIEIKCDETEYQSWNLFVEYISCKRLNTNGWLYKTKADFICYVFSKRGCFFMIPTDKLRKLIEAYEFKSKEAHDVYKTSIGYLVPSSMFSDYKNEDIDLKDRFDEFYKSPESKYLG